jgi:hypothetical protein
VVASSRSPPVVPHNGTAMSPQSSQSRVRVSSVSAVQSSLIHAGRSSADGPARRDEALQVGEQGVTVAVQVRPDSFRVTLERVMGHGGTPGRPAGHRVLVMDRRAARRGCSQRS